jgi:hypothetical protein
VNDLRTGRSAVDGARRGGACGRARRPGGREAGRDRVDEFRKSLRMQPLKQHGAFSRSAIPLREVAFEDDDTDGSG